MGFHVGQLVVCVETWTDVWNGLDTGPTRGTVYTIRETVPEHPWYQGVPCVRLVEIVNPVHDFPSVRYESCFGTFRFRPVDENRIEVFRQIAASPKKRIRIGEDA